ncbi:MAG: protease pro-enzyme activation domain-containing protein [Candidatus Velthaea sp.]
MIAALKRTARLVLAASFAITASACGGGSASPPRSALPVAPVASTGAKALAFGAPALTGAAPGAPARLGTMAVTVGVRLRDGAGLATYAAAAGDPASALYRRFLTPQEIAERYGASTADYAAAAAYLRGFGLNVGSWPQRLALSVAGPQSAMEAAFHTHFLQYAAPSGPMYGPRETPAVSAGVPIVAVSHLIDGRNRVFRQSVRATASGQNVQLGYAPQQIAAAFDYTGAYNAHFTGKSINVGIIGTGPIDMRDFAAYKSRFGYGGSGTIAQVNVGSAASAAAGSSPTATPPPATGPCAGALPACNPEDGEAQLDVEQVNGLAPDANVLFYLAYVPDECNGPPPPCAANQDFGPQLGINEFEAELQQAIADNTADALSLSFGGGERGMAALFADANGAYDPTGVGPTMFAALAAEGIAVFVSSGDSGAQGCARPVVTGFVDSQCVSYPASDVSVTSVGGVTTPLDNAGRFVGPVTGWGQQTSGGFAASGGGVSAFMPAPSWQTGAGVPTAHRTEPDVSLDGDNFTGVAVIANTPGLIGPTGGTSVSAPELAAMWALVLDACKQTAACTARGGGARPWRLGNAAPVLYGIYNDAAKYPATFLDVTFGNNGVIGCTQGLGCPSPRPTADPGFSAGTGYDNVTGIGVPFARHLIQAVVGV